MIKNKEHYFYYGCPGVVILLLEPRFSTQGIFTVTFMKRAKPQSATDGTLDRRLFRASRQIIPKVFSVAAQPPPTVAGTAKPATTSAPNAANHPRPLRQWQQLLQANIAAILVQYYAIGRANFQAVSAVS